MTTFIPEDDLENRATFEADDSMGYDGVESVADDDNVGSLTLENSPATIGWYIDMVATADGSTATIEDTALLKYPVSSLVGLTVEITESGHGAEGETSTISTIGRLSGDSIEPDFLPNGKIEVSSPFTATISSGDSYRIKRDVTYFDYVVTIVRGESDLDATYKYSVNGGNSFIGIVDLAATSASVDIYTAGDSNHMTTPSYWEDWGVQYGSSAKDRSIKIVERSNKDIFIFVATEYFSSNDCYVFFTKSTDGGTSWSTATAIDKGAAANGYNYLHAVERVNNKDLVVFYYDPSQATDHRQIVATSSDGGDSWSLASMDENEIRESFVALDNGNIVAFSDVSSEIVYETSTDGGQSWSSFTTIHELDNYINPDAFKRSNGNIAITAINHSENECYYMELNDSLEVSKEPTLALHHSDIDQYYRAMTGEYFETPFVGMHQFDKAAVSINFSKDTEGTFSTGTDRMFGIKLHEVTSPYSDAYVCSDNSLLIVSAHYTEDIYWKKFGGYIPETASTSTFVFGGISCNVSTLDFLLPHGEIYPNFSSSVTANDSWTFKITSTLEPINIIRNGPRYPWASSTDSTSNNLNITIDDYDSVIPTGIGVYGCNMKDLSFQIASSSTFTTKYVNLSLDFTLATGTAESINGNAIKAPTILANYYDHELVGKYFTDTNNNSVYKIEDNIGDYLLLKSFDPVSNLSTNGLVGYWSFNESSGATAEDESGNSLDAVLHGTPSWVVGKSGYALSFNGTDQYGVVSHDTALDFTSEDFSVSFWAKPDASNTSPGRVVAKCDIETSGWEIWVRSSDGYIGFATNQAGIRQIARTYELPDDGEWHHIVVVRDGATVTFYIDNVEYSNVSDDVTNPASNTDDLYIARRQDTDAAHFPGSLDEIRIYNKVLTRDEINSLYFGFEIFQDHTAATFSLSTPSQHLRFHVEPQNTADGYFIIGYATIGRAFSPTKNWAVGCEETYLNQSSMIMGRTGNIIPVTDEYNLLFRLNWKAESTDNEKIINFLNFLEDRSVTILPSDDNQNCYLTRFTGDISEAHIENNRVNLSASFVETL